MKRSAELDSLIQLAVNYSTTIVAGAFVAGMDAGLMYNEYPLMGGSIIPENYGEYKFLDPFENPASAQRSKAIILFKGIWNIGKGLV